MLWSTGDVGELRPAIVISQARHDGKMLLTQDNTIIYIFTHKWQMNN